MVDLLCDFDSIYEIPSNEILQNRQTFYSLLRKDTDKSTTWLKEVQSCSRRCDFPTTITEFLLLDRFVGGLNANELKSIRTASKSWILKQLLEHYSNGNIELEHSEGNLEYDTLDIVKSESVGLSQVELH